jgi:Tfp pilus assembly protein PilV
VVNNRGLTLTEILGAMTILGFVVILLVNISDYTVVRTSKGDQKYNALVLAENQLKQIVFETNQANQPAIGTISAKAPIPIEGYTVHFDEFPITGPYIYNPSTPISPVTQVSVQAIVNLYNNPNPIPVQRLVTVTVSWGG